jgi:hypothetical protein
VKPIAAYLIQEYNTSQDNGTLITGPLTDKVGFKQRARWQKVKLMEKVQKSYRKTYPMLRLFKDDVKQIVNLVEKSHKDAEIIIDEYKIEDGSEIDKISKQITTKFYIQFFQRYHDENPYRTEMLTLDLTNDNASLRVSNENDTYLRGIASQIDSILSGRKRKIINFLFSVPIIILIAFLISLPAAIILSLPWSFNKQPSLAISLTLIVILLIILAILWFIWAFNIEFKKHVVIYLINSNERSSFFSRNRDEIPKMVLSALIGSIITILLGGISFLINWLVHLIH